MPLENTLGRFGWADDSPQLFRSGNAPAVLVGHVQHHYAELPWVATVSHPAQYFVSHMWRRPFQELLYCLWRRF